MTGIAGEKCSQVKIIIETSNCVDLASITGLAVRFSAFLWAVNMSIANARQHKQLVFHV
jgi:hypothetical protein